MATVATGTGATITFATSGFVANIVAIGLGRIMRPAVDTTHMRTTRPGANQFGGRTYIPGKLADPGYLNLDVHFNPQEPPPIHGDPEPITITYPGDPFTASPGQTRVTSGFVTRFEIESGIDTTMRGRIEIKISGIVVPLAPTVVDPNPPPISVCLSGGVVAFWAMDESSGLRLDSGPSAAYHLSPTTAIATVTGKIGNAVKFSSLIGDALTTAHAPALSFGNASFSVAAWVQIHTSFLAQNLLFKGTTPLLPNSIEYLLTYDPNTGGHFSFFISNTAEHAGASEPGPVVADTWYFVVGRYDATADILSVSVNAGTPATVAFIHGSHSGTNALRVGSYNGSVSGFAGATVDAVGLWTCALSDAEVTTLYNGGAGQQYPFS